jgi:hypothetical protein
MRGKERVRVRYRCEFEWAAFPTTAFRAPPPKSTPSPFQGEGRGEVSIQSPHSQHPNQNPPPHLSKERAGVRSPSCRPTIKIHPSPFQGESRGEVSIMSPHISKSPLSYR